MKWKRDTLPKIDQTVLVCDIKKGIISLADYEHAEKTFHTMSIDELDDDYEVTHWMPLPKQPID